MGSKMEPKLVKNLIKFRVDFCNVFEYPFSRSWIDFGSKNLSKMRGLGVTFSTSLRICEKCDFEQPSYGFAIFFSTLGWSIFDLKRYMFQVFFLRCFQDVFFSNLGRNWDQIRCQMRPQIDLWAQKPPRMKPEIGKNCYGSIFPTNFLCYAHTAGLP